MNPHIINLLIKGHQEKLKIQMQVQDTLNWYMGQYVMSALDGTVCNSGLWRKRGSRLHEYIKKPILQSTESNGKEESQNKESQEEIAVFEMKQRIKALRAQGLPESPE